MKHFRVLVIMVLLFTILFLRQTILAGGGRMVISVVDPSIIGTINDGLEVRAFMGTLSDGNTPSQNEYAEFRIVNPRTGDRCDTSNNSRTNVNGYLSGNCIASIPGTISIYVHSFDFNDESSVSLLTFVVPTPTQTPTPIVVSSGTSPTAKPTNKPTSTVTKSTTIEASTTTLSPTITALTTVPIATGSSQTARSQPMPPVSTTINSAQTIPIFVPVAMILGFLLLVVTGIFAFQDKLRRKPIIFESSVITQPGSLDAYTPLNAT